jgi:transcription elongation factor GreA
MADEVLLTKEGYEKLVAEHEELVSVRRLEVAARLKEAISYGDLSENAEYDSAKNEQAELEERIYKLENMIKTAKIIDESAVSKDVVNLGMRVKVENTATKEKDEYTIVGSTEADPFNGKISNESAMGAALLGKKKGETFELQVPDGIFTYKVVSINK